jgi:hypothetical protein
MSTTPTADPNRIMLENVRLSYPHLFVPRASEEGKEPKFSASFILDKKKHAPLIAKLEKLIERVALDFFKKKVALKKTCLRDGNEKADNDGYGDEVMFVTSSAGKNKRPAVLDADKTKLVEGDSRPYAGCYVNALLRLYAYDHKVGGKGVAAGLLAVQFVEDGPAFGAAPVDTDAVFKDVSGSESVDDI